MTSPASRRAAFPRGLMQPEGSYRFGADALLLAAWAAACFAPHDPIRFADLGTGCGAVALALLLLRPQAEGVGVDQEPELIRAAAANVRGLGLENRLTAVCGDLADPQTASRVLACLPEQADLILSNPPWYEEGKGRPPTCALRRAALFGGPGTLSLFAQASARLLAPDGRCCSAVGAFRARDQLAALEEAGLRPCRMREVCSLPGRVPWLVLIEATRSPARLVVESPLLLADGQGRPGPEAVALCPFLHKDSFGL